MNEWDIEAQREYAVRVGREEGRAEGRTEGRAEGLAEGEANAKASVARTMLQENLPVEQIARLTGLTATQIRAL